LWAKIRANGQHSKTEFFITKHGWKINHACQPNVYWSEQKQLIAIQDIKKGDEITVSYTHPQPWILPFIRCFETTEHMHCACLCRYCTQQDHPCVGCIESKRRTMTTVMPVKPLASSSSSSSSSKDSLLAVSSTVQPTTDAPMSPNRISPMPLNLGLGRTPERVRGGGGGVKGRDSPLTLNFEVFVDQEQAEMKYWLEYRAIYYNTHDAHVGVLTEKKLGTHNEIDALPARRLYELRQFEAKFNSPFSKLSLWSWLTPSIAPKHDDDWNLPEMPGWLQLTIDHTRMETLMDLGIVWKVVHSEYLGYAARMVEVCRSSAWLCPLPSPPPPPLRPPCAPSFEARVSKVMEHGFKGKNLAATLAQEHFWVEYVYQLKDWIYDKKKLDKSVPPKLTAFIEGIVKTVEGDTDFQTSTREQKSPSPSAAASPSTASPSSSPSSSPSKKEDNPKDDGRKRIARKKTISPPSSSSASSASTTTRKRPLFSAETQDATKKLCIEAPATAPAT
jgi:hypothetical protein